ncbi:zinc dependent phospholipase C family protein [Flexithrix dorotheae]|uniref:zinc dependent phospholipase C family protein n=1 Tax=Flexithrix dorotheae TaxID=70993 RepID=UPI000370FA44|nr:zinc dependent phospholipase C family protein [Flexithrix dorotheae]
MNSSLIFFLIIKILTCNTSCFQINESKPVRNYWGFYAHRLINKSAVFLLPPEMFGFYKKNIRYIEENAVNPDARRYIIREEAPRHYIDLDVYGEHPFDSLPKYWKEAVEKYGLDTLNNYGIVPWHIHTMKFRLTEAFKRKDTEYILKMSTEIGHYIADANVPLHTTENYNGQLTNQVGIHGLWESRLPEMFAPHYNLFMNKAKYLENTQLEAWNAVRNANMALDSVLKFEREATQKIGIDKKYSFEEGKHQRVYSKDFCKVYHKMLNGMVERRMRASIKMVADFWFTSWVDAGQPDLNLLLDPNFSEEQFQQMQIERKRDAQSKKVNSRQHETVPID